MRAIKALVIGLGAIIVLLVALVIWGVSRQAESLRSSGFEDLSLGVPAGCSLAAVEPGRGDLLLLRLEGPAERGCQQAILVDGASGRIAGRITLRPE